MNAERKQAEEINQKAIEYAKLKHKDEYDDPAFARDISESEIDYARGYTAALAEERAKMPSDEDVMIYFDRNSNCVAKSSIKIPAMTRSAVLIMTEWFRNRMKEGGE